MSAPTIQYLYVLILSIYGLVEIGLTLLNLRFSWQHSGEIPEIFKGSIDEDTYRRSIHYTVAKGKLSIANTLFSIFLLILFIKFGWFGEIDHWLSGHLTGMYLQGVGYVIVLMILFWFLNLPFSLYGTFVIEERFGFNKTSPKLWIIDSLKSIALSTIILTPILFGLFWFMRAAGAYWWIYAVVFIFLVQLTLVYLYPVCIAPLFNKFTPLDEGELKDEIVELTNQVDYQVSGVFVMDGSKRSAHANAYFTGFGKNKRIVLFDTLIDSLKKEGALAVLAHEIGHEKHHHIKKQLALSLVFLCLGFWILSELLTYQPLFTAFGFEAMSYHGALVIFSFASEPITYFLSPLSTGLSRRFEFQADKFAAAATGNGEDLSEALLTLSKKSLSNFNPHPLYSFFHYSHPTLSERINALLTD